MDDRTENGSFADRDRLLGLIGWGIGTAGAFVLLFAEFCAAWLWFVMDLAWDAPALVIWAVILGLGLCWILIVGRFVIDPALYLVRIGTSGLVVWRGPFRRRRVAWDAIEGVEVREDHATIVTAEEALTITPAIQDWLRLAARVAREIGTPEPVVATAETVDRETIAGWRGLRPNDALSCPVGRTGLPLPMVLAGMGISAAVAFGWRAAGFPRSECLLAFFEMLSVTLLRASIATSDGRPGRVRAEPGGLTLRDPRETCIAWREVHAIQPYRGVWRVSTTRRDFVLPDTAVGRRLAAVVEKVVAARREGLALPHLEVVPDSAISRVSIAEPRADRGISRSDDP